MRNGSEKTTATATTATPTTNKKSTPAIQDTVSPSADQLSDLPIDYELSPQDLDDLEDLLFQLNTTHNAIGSFPVDQHKNSENAHDEEIEKDRINRGMSADSAMSRPMSDRSARGMSEDSTMRRPVSEHSAKRMSEDRAIDRPTSQHIVRPIPEQSARSMHEDHAMGNQHSARGMSEDSGMSEHNETPLSEHSAMGSHMPQHSAIPMSENNAIGRLMPQHSARPTSEYSAIPHQSAISSFAIPTSEHNAMGRHMSNRRSMPMSDYNGMDRPMSHRSSMPMSGSDRPVFEHSARPMPEYNGVSRPISQHDARNMLEHGAWDVAGHSARPSFQHSARDRPKFEHSARNMPKYSSMDISKHRAMDLYRHGVNKSVEEKRAQEDMDEFNAMASQADVIYSLKSDAIFPNQSAAITNRRMMAISNDGAHYNQRATYFYGEPSRVDSRPILDRYHLQRAVADNFNRRSASVFKQFNIRPKVEGRTGSSSSKRLCRVESPCAYGCYPEYMKNIHARDCGIACCPENETFKCQCVRKCAHRTENVTIPSRCRCSRDCKLTCYPENESFKCQCVRIYEYPAENISAPSGCHNNCCPDKLKAMFRRDINPLERVRVSDCAPFNGKRGNEGPQRQHACAGVLNSPHRRFDRCVYRHRDPCRITKKRKHIPKCSDNTNEDGCVTSSRSFRQTPRTSACQPPVIPPKRTLSDRVKGVLYSLKRVIVPNRYRCPPPDSCHESCQQSQCETVMCAVRKRHCSQDSNQSTVSSCDETDSMPRCPHHERQRRKPNSINCTHRSVKRSRKR